MDKVEQTARRTMAQSGYHALPPKNISVIGAGIVGVSAALYLQRDGHNVTIYDPCEPGFGASYGNAGIVAVNSAVPIVMPGILKRIPSMLLDPYGPLKIQVKYGPHILPWLTRLVLATRTSKIERTARALSDLLGGVNAAYQELLEETKASDLVRPVGRLKLFSSPEGYQNSKATRELSKRLGIVGSIVNKDEICDLEPALAPIFERGIFDTDCSFVVNPKRLVDEFFKGFLHAGGKFIQEPVEKIDYQDRIRKVVTNKGSYDSDVIVVAAGAWSRKICRTIGVKIPLDTERGYHLMLPHSETRLNRPVYWSEHYLNLCPMEQGVRMTTGVEFGGLDLPADFTRIRRLLPTAQKMLPTLPITSTSEWLGFRPSLPDSLPILSGVPGIDGIFLAFGHHHLGLTLGPASGRIIADLVAGRSPEIDLDPFRVNRSYWR